MAVQYSTPTADMSGKVVLITGGTRGLGRAMAFGFAQAGAKLVVSSRKQDACDQTAREINESGGEATGIAAHVGYWDQCDSLAEKVYDAMGRVDVLINNAGLSPIYSSLPEVTEDLFDKVMNVNLKGPFRLASLIGDRMNRGGGGSIINISSIAAVKAQWHTAPYSMAKAGLNAMTRCLGDAFAPKVRVNAIMCGPFRTDASRGWADSDQFKWRAKHLIPMHRIGEAEEVFGAALYFASDLSSYTTRKILAIDGGET